MPHSRTRSLRFPRFWFGVGLLPLAALPFAWGQSSPTRLFTPAERARVVAFWSEPGRYQSALPLAAGPNGPWQVRLTPEGSRWFLAYQRALGAVGAPPTTDTAGAVGPQAGWEKWVQARLEADRHAAQSTADAANASLRVPPTAPATPPPPPNPGPIPEDLAAAAGNPPTLAQAVTPLQHTISFADGEVYQYTDHVGVRPRYPYYRFPQG
ncbi:MAG: hypothetical protein FJX77_15035, partial [Armatimonadetes bacterium]|nr:hypothetical protein [Armatimonadota bacterium]